MVGIYLNNDVYTAVYNWSDHAISSRTGSEIITSHVSEFIDANLSGARLIEHSINVFLEVIKIVVNKGVASELKPLLVISLDCSDNISFWDGSIPLVSQLGDEPPSIYLIDKAQVRGFERVEEYKIPIDINLPGIAHESCNVYYRCFRNQMAIENQWEFSRAIYIEKSMGSD